MSGNEQAREIVALVKRLKAEYPPPPGAEDPAAPCPCGVDHAEPLLGEFLRAFLVWEATSAKAALALKRIEEAVVDFNELRICLPDELVSLLGERYPRVEERALRMRAALIELYHREHAVTLQPLLSLGKREAKDYLDSLDGVPRYVSSRVALLCLGVHAAPVDGRIAKRLVEADIAEPGSNPDAAAASLERKVRAGDMLEVYRLLQSWADDAPLNYSETPVELPRRKPRAAPMASHEARKRPAKAAARKRSPG